MLRFLCWVTFFALSASPASAWQKNTQYSLYGLASDGSRTVEVMAIDEFLMFGSPDISPDGKKFAADGWKVGQDADSAHLLIVDLESGEISDLGNGAMPTWSPDGSLLAFTKYHGGGVVIRSLDGKSSKQIDSQGFGVQWSPDGRKLAYPRGGQLVIYDILTETKKEIFPADALPYEAMYWNGAWSPDCTRFCLKARKSKDNHELIIVKVDGDKPDVHVCGPANDLLEDVAWHPDGTRIVISNYSGRMLEYRVDGSVPLKELKGQPDDRKNWVGTWTRDGKVLMFLCTPQN